MENTIPARIKRTQRDYTLGFKLQVFAAVEKGDMTYKQAQKIYGIQWRSTVLAWVRLPVLNPQPKSTQSFDAMQKLLSMQHGQGKIMDKLS